jgi:hypothetical protein
MNGRESASGLEYDRYIYYLLGEGQKPDPQPMNPTPQCRRILAHNSLWTTEDFVNRRRKKLLPASETEIPNPMVRTFPVEVSAGRGKERKR